MRLGDRAELVLKFAAILLMGAGLLRALFNPGGAAFLLAVPPLAAVGWRRQGAFLAASAFAGLALLAQLGILLSLGSLGQTVLMGLAFLALLGVTTYTCWTYITEADQRSHARRQVLEDLEEDLVQVREELGVQERSLQLSENRRKRYNRLQDALGTFSSTLDSEGLARMVLHQCEQLLGDLPVEIRVYLLDGSGRATFEASRGVAGAAADALPLQGDALNTWVLAKGASLVIKDLEKDFRFRGLDMAQFKGRSFHLSPILSAQGQVAGLVRIESAKREAMDQEDQRILESLMVLASLALENAKLHREAQELAVTDGLTRLMLRRPLMEKLETELQRAVEQDETMSLIMLDIDHFKSVNDTYGHPAGDAVLREVAAILKRSVRDVDICGRYGGEEFIVLLPQTGIDGAMAVAERIREGVRSKLMDLRGDQRQVTVSLGVAVAPDDAREPQALIAKADSALYASKQSGRDKVTRATGGAA